VGVIILFSVPAERVGEDKSDKDEVKKAEGIKSEIWEEGQSNHLNKGLL
jgi:hypothetical protein